jgi:hypothetical protein
MFTRLYNGLLATFGVAGRSRLMRSRLFRNLYWRAWFALPRP